MLSLNSAVCALTSSLFRCLVCLVWLMCIAYCATLSCLVKYLAYLLRSFFASFFSNVSLRTCLLCIVWLKSERLWTSRERFCSSPVPLGLRRGDWVQFCSPSIPSIVFSEGRRPQPRGYTSIYWDWAFASLFAVRGWFARVIDNVSFISRSP